MVGKALQPSLSRSATGRLPPGVLEGAGVSVQEPKSCGLARVRSGRQQRKPVNEQRRLGWVPPPFPLLSSHSLRHSLACWGARTLLKTARGRLEKARRGCKEALCFFLSEAPHAPSSAVLLRCVHRVSTSRARAVVAAAAVYHSEWHPSSGSGCTVSSFAANNTFRATGFPRRRPCAGTGARVHSHLTPHLLPNVNDAAVCKGARVRKPTGARI